MYIRKSGGRGIYFFASATARARMARFFSSTLMGLTATAGAIGVPGPAPPMSTEFVEVVRARRSTRTFYGCQKGLARDSGLAYVDTLENTTHILLTKRSRRPHDRHPLKNRRREPPDHGVRRAPRPLHQRPKAEQPQQPRQIRKIGADGNNRPIERAS